MTELNWARVSRGEPCPVCAKPDYCQVSRDGSAAMCMRVGGGREGRNRAGAPYSIHQLRDAPPRPVIRPRVLSRPVAPVEVRDRVYRRLLDRLELYHRHRADLRKRGLSDDEIQRRGYRTFVTGEHRQSIVQALADEFGPALAQVPGFLEAGVGEFRLFGSSGILIPVRDESTRILAMRVRRDIGEGRYRWVSCSEESGGCRSGAPCHVPLHDGPRETVRVTEGELKADVATALSGILTIAAPGAQQWAGVLPILQNIQPRRVLIAYDPDWKTNPAVARALLDLTRTIAGAGFEVGMEVWTDDNQN